MCGKLAVCVPTYQNPDDIRHLIQYELPIYVELGINLYIMDSSTDDLTEVLVRHEQIKCQSLFYMRFPSDMPSNIKVFKAFQMAGNEIPCDYIWVRSDILSADRRLLEPLVRILVADKYDFLVINPQGLFSDDVLEMNDRQELFEKYTWILTMYGAAILSVKHMLRLADWNYVEKRYLTDKCINYSHVCLFFELLNAINYPRILVINTGIFFRYIHDKTATWESMTFPITLMIWPNAINSLPNTYKNKMEVIHSLLDDRFFGYQYLEKLALKGILTSALVDRYREEIEQYTNVSIEDVYAIANGEHLYKESNNEPDYEPLLQFARKYKKLVIYGYGKRGKRYAKYLSENGIVYEAFLATCVDENIEVLNHQVIQADRYIFTEETGVILGIRPGYQIDVYEFIEARGLSKCTFSYPTSFEDIPRFLAKLGDFAATKQLS